MSNPKTVLLVGGSGQLGNAIINALIAKNSYVHIRVLGRHHDEEVLKLGYVCHFSVHDLDAPTSPAFGP